MAEQSSAVVVFRAGVMLLCLVAVPVAALFGPALPDAIKAVREKRWSDVFGSGTKASGAAARNLEEAPRFEPAPVQNPPALLPSSKPEGAESEVSPAAAPNLARRWPGNGQESGAGVLPANYVENAGGEVAGPAPVRPAAGSADPFVLCQDRLRQLGATYYFLEQWGKDKYRFHCRMAVGGNPNYTRPFEATDSDPLRAMNQVVDKVEAWRSGRL